MGPATRVGKNSANTPNSTIVTGFSSAMVGINQIMNKFKNEKR